MTKLNKAEIDALTARLHGVITSEVRSNDRKVYAKYVSLFYKTKEGKTLEKAHKLFPTLSVSNILITETKKMGYVPLKLNIYHNEIRNKVVLLNSEKIGMVEIINLIAKQYKVTIED